MYFPEGNLAFDCSFSEVSVFRRRHRFCWYYCCPCAKGFYLLVSSKHLMIACLVMWDIHAQSWPMNCTRGTGFLIIIIPIDRSYQSTMIFIPVATISYSVPGCSDLKHIKKKWCEIYGEGNFCLCFRSGLELSPCFPYFLDRTTFVPVSL